MSAWTRKLAWCGAVVSIVVCSAVITAQEKSGQTDLGSLAALTTEVRQLRLAVEESTRTQAQTQALGVYLSAQQSRLTQLAARLDAAREEINAVTLRSRQMSADLLRINEALLHETNPQGRSGLELESRALKQELDNIGLRDQQARSREAEIYQTLQTENTRWNDLISTLEKLIRK